LDAKPLFPGSWTTAPDCVQFQPSLSLPGCQAAVREMRSGAQAHGMLLNPSIRLPQLRSTPGADRFQLRGNKDWQRVACDRQPALGKGGRDFALPSLPFRLPFLGCKIVLNRCTHGV